MSWTAPPEHGSAVTGYEIDRSTDAAQTWTVLTTIPDTSIELPAPAPGRLVHYRVIAESDAGPSEPSGTYLQTAGAHTQRFTVVSADGRPVTRGMMRWSDGYGSWSKFIPMTPDGQVDLPSVQPGSDMLFDLIDGYLPDGVTAVSKEWSVDFGTDPQTLVVPDPPAMETRHVSVVMPDGTPVVGAQIDADYDQGLSEVVQQDGFTWSYYGEDGDNRSTGTGGTIDLHGWSAEGIDYIPASKFPYPEQAVHLIYDDGVNHQESDFDLTGEYTTITVDPVPWVSTAPPATTAIGRTATVDITVHPAPAATNGASTPRAAKIAGVKVSLTPPRGWTAKRCASKSIMSGVSDARGRVSLRVCGSATGTFRVHTVGADRSGGVVMRVWHAAPAAPASAGATSTQKGELTAQWVPPAYSGGAPVTRYVVTLSAPGHASRTYSVPASARSRTFDGLTRTDEWTAAVQAVTRFGTGAAATASTRVY